MPLSILEPVAVSLYVDRRAMVENPIQNGRSNNVISEDIALAKFTLNPALTASIPNEMARCVFPTPGGPRKTTFSAL